MRLQNVRETPNGAEDFRTFPSPCLSEGTKSVGKPNSLLAGKMENSHYFLKTLGLESFISHDPLRRMDMDNFELEKIKAEEHNRSNDSTKNDMCDKQEIISEEVNQITGNVQADDFFSSLELQSSSKTSTNMLSLSFSNKLAGGIVTRSRSFSSNFHDTSKSFENIVSELKNKGRSKKKLKRKKSEKHCIRKIRTKEKHKKMPGGKKSSSDGKDKVSQLAESKKQSSNKSDENILEKSLGYEKSKDDDDWVLFNNLNSKREVDDKMFENKPILSNDLQNPIRRCTPELFSMSSILINDGMSEEKDVVDNLLEVEDYDDCFLEEMEELNYAPPRSHTGGKWKPGCLTIRTSPMLWQNSNWDSFLDEERKNRAETPADSPTDSINKFSVASNCKWKSFAPPATYTGGKWKPMAPPATHTGGKWKSDFIQRGKKLDQDLIFSVENDHNWKYENEREMEPPPTHTGGKWKPSSNHATESWKAKPESKLELEDSSFSRVQEKWASGSEKTTIKRSTLDVIADCQSTSGKCLKASGGMIQYYCSPCNRRLSSKRMYKKHVQSELHFKRVLQENELEFDSRSLKLFHGLFTQAGCRERGLGKRIVKKPEMYNNSEMGHFKREKKISTLVKIKGKRIARREIIRCEVCKVKIPSFQLGKHLVSYYHSRRIQLNDPEQRKLILDNIHAIVKQAPYQCGICKFYCNTQSLFKKHWALSVHKEMERSKNQRFWCALCSFECETSRSMELHLDSNSHREVILAVNKSIPIIIRHKVIFNCSFCFREFRFNRELMRHQKIFHETAASDKSNKFACSICQQNCKNFKSLQRHILQSHKGDAKVPYFCSTCNEFFNTSSEAKSHRNSHSHKYKKTSREQGENCKLSLSRSCFYCEETLENLTKLKAHLLEKHPEFLPKCIKCGMLFALSQEVSQHVKNNECDFSHKKSELFACESCPFSTNTKSEFLLHTAVHQKKTKDDKKIPCPLCGSLFTQTSLSIHLRTHLKERTYVCAICSKAFVRRDRYVSHLKLKHRSEQNVEVSSASNANSKEGNKEDTKEENKIKEGIELAAERTQKDTRSEKKAFEKRQLCGDAKCKYVAKDLNDLENHSIFHVGPKIYQCPECPYSAKTSTIIKRHYMIHIDERSFPCHLCSFKARLKSHLKRHMRLHTGAKPYKCPHCSYTCSILENLRKHVLYTKIHPGKKLYECKSCNFSTNVSKDFKIHLFKNHKDDYRYREPNEVAGIYNRDEDFKNSENPLPVKPRSASYSKPSKVYTAAFKKKLDTITRKFSSIAPKPLSTSEGMVSSALNLKNTGNLIEDKRNILKMELEKLKSQIKPATQKLPRSYPSPAEKDKMKATLSENKQNEIAGDKKAQEVKRIPKECNSSSGSVLSQTSDLEKGVFLVNMTPTVISMGEESPPKVIKSDQSLQQMEFPSACILYENVLPSDEMELYLLDYQI